MKTRNDPRHIKRVRAVQDLFAWEFNQQKIHNSFVVEVTKSLSKIDKLITEAAPMWPIEKINKIDLAILRVAVYELMIEKKNPPKVIIDEAVEISKEYGSDSTPSFVNGALGKLLENKNITP